MSFSEHGVIDHFVLRADDRVDLLARHYRVRVSLVADHVPRSRERCAVVLHDDPDPRHHVASRALLLRHRRSVADLGVDLFAALVVRCPNELRRRWQRRQAVAHPGIVGLQLDACRYLQHAGRYGPLHRLLGVLVLIASLVGGSFRLQAGITLLRPHGYLRPYRERERGGFLGGVAIPVALSEFRDPLQDAVTVTRLRAAPLPRTAPLKMLQPVLQALQNRLGLRLRLDLLQIHLLQALPVARRVQLHGRHSRFRSAVPDRSAEAEEPV